MKKYSSAHIVALVLGVLIVILAFTLSSEAQNADDAFQLKNGSRLAYSYNKGEDTYNLVMTVDAVKPDIIFDWKATGGTAERKGHVTYVNKEIETGRNIHSDLTDGDDRSNAGVLWFSRVQLRELRLGKTIYQKDGAKNNEGIVVLDKNKMNVSVNGVTKALDVIHAKTVMSGSNDEFWILNNEDYPLVLKATISGTSFEIKNINL